MNKSMKQLSPFLDTEFPVDYGKLGVNNSGQTIMLYDVGRHNSRAYFLRMILASQLQAPMRFVNSSRECNQS